MGMHHIWLAGWLSSKTLALAHDVTLLPFPMSLNWPMTIHKQLPPISCSVLLGQLACIGSLGTQLAAEKIRIGPTI